jgi:circadian clock protein KaiC
MTPAPSHTPDGHPRAPSAELPIQKAPTGIAGFDEITGGGLPAGRATLLLGGPGAGKTVFALETLVNAARQWREPGIFVAFEENSRQIIGNAATFGWDLPALEQERLFFLDARLSPTTVQSGDFDISAMLQALSQKVAEMGAKRIVFDGIDVLLTLLDNPTRERREVHRLQEWLQEHGLTALITAKASVATPDTTERYGFMQFMMDAVVAFYHRMVDRVSLRGIRVMKYRGSSFFENEFPFIISQAGVEVSTFGQSSLDYTVFTDRVSTGVARLDTMLEGGYYRGSSILISGAPGTAKTTLAGAFTAATCRRGERMLYVSFDESGKQIIRNLKSVGIMLQSFHDSGLLEFYAMRTEARSADEHLAGLRECIRRLKPKGMVLDPISALGKTGGQVAALHSSLRLIDLARSEGITLVCTSLVPDEDGFEHTATQISTIADTWIHLAYLIHGGERNRTLTVVKSRGTRHSNQVRELILSNAGVTLADVFTAGGSVLVGTARWEYEAQQRERSARRDAARARRRRDYERATARIRERIAALEHELASHQEELKDIESVDTRSAGRRKSDLAQLLQLRHADPDTKTDAGPRGSEQG